MFLLTTENPSFVILQTSNSGTSQNASITASLAELYWAVLSQNTYTGVSALASTESATFWANVPATRVAQRAAASTLAFLSEAPDAVLSTGTSLSPTTVSLIAEQLLGEVSLPKVVAGLSPVSLAASTLDALLLSQTIVEPTSLGFLSNLNSPAIRAGAKTIAQPDEIGASLYSASTILPRILQAAVIETTSSVYDPFISTYTKLIPQLIESRFQTNEVDVMFGALISVAVDEILLELRNVLAGLDQSEIRKIQARIETLTRLHLSHSPNTVRFMEHFSDRIEMSAKVARQGLVLSLPIIQKHKIHTEN